MSFNTPTISNSNPYRIEAYKGNQREDRYLNNRYAQRAALVQEDIIEADTIASKEGNILPTLIYFHWIEESSKPIRMQRRLTQFELPSYDQYLQQAHETHSVAQDILSKRKSS